MSARFINTVTEPQAMRHAVANWMTSEVLQLRGSGEGTIRLLSPWLSPVDVFSPAIGWDALISVLGRAPRNILDVLLGYARLGGVVRMLVRQASDPVSARTINMLTQWEGRRTAGVEIRSSPREHAKIWVGERLVFFGSSNLTEGGLGQNRELMEIANARPRIEQLQREADVFLDAAEPATFGGP
jgi:hypothetical protein